MSDELNEEPSWKSQPPVPPANTTPLEPRYGRLEDTPQEPDFAGASVPGAATPANPSPAGGSVLVRAITVVMGVPAAATITVSTP